MSVSPVPDLEEKAIVSAASEIAQDSSVGEWPSSDANEGRRFNLENPPNFDTASIVFLTSNWFIGTTTVTGHSYTKTGSAKICGT